MAKVTYSFSMNTQVAFNTHPTASLSGPSSQIPSGAIVTNVEVEIYCGVGTGGYNTYLDTCATLTDIYGNTFDVDSSVGTGSESRITASWDEGVSKEESASMDWNNLRTIELSGTSKLFVRDDSATLTIEYIVPTNCGAPTSVTINGSSSKVDTGETTATLAWSGASGGSNNSIAGYVVLYRESSNGTSWSDWYSYSERDISSTSSSGSLTVNLGEFGTYRQFKIGTFGTAGKDYMSDYKESPVVFRTRTACTPPTNVSLAATSSTGANVRLSWSGASAGMGNSISGYEVQRRESTDGSSWGSWSTVGTTPNTYLNVVPPATAGNYYQYQVRTLGNAGASYNSGWKASSNTLRRSYTACGAPTSCAVDSALSLVATTLRWSGATAGYGNPISKYEVQRRSKVHGGAWSAWSAFETTSGTSLSVSPPATAGHYYQYRVRAQGTAGEAYYSGWKESTNTLRKAHKTIPAFTDLTLIVGQTDVKAVHITELQNVLNDILLPFMGMGKVTFTELERDSDAKYWSAHVQEIKDAIDSTGFSHEVWITMQDEVTADVIEQLRRIVKSM